MFRTLTLLPAVCAGVVLLLDPAPARQPKAPVPKVVPLPKDIKAALLKRVTIESTADIPLMELLAGIAKKHNLKFLIDKEAFLAEGVPNLGEKKIGEVGGKDIRLDVLLDLIMTAAGAQPEIRKDVIVLVPHGTGRQITTLRQPPDATHAAAVAANKKKLATRVNMDASNDIPLAEFLQFIAKKHGLTFVFREETFREAGVPNPGSKKVKIKAAKNATLETVLRDALQSVDADLVLDAYGNFIVVSKSTGANME